MSDVNSHDPDVDALAISGDERPLDSVTEIERGTEGLWTPASLGTHDTLPGHAPLCTTRRPVPAGIGRCSPVP